MLGHQLSVPKAPPNPVIRRKKMTIPKLPDGRSSTRKAITVAEPVSQEMLKELGISDDEADDPKGPSRLDQGVRSPAMIEDVLGPEQPQPEPADAGTSTDEGLDGVKSLENLQFPEFCTACYDADHERIFLRCKNCPAQICMNTETNLNMGCLKYSKQLNEDKRPLCPSCCNNQKVSFKYSFNNNDFHSNLVSGSARLYPTLIISIEWFETAPYFSPGVITRELFGGMFMEYCDALRLERFILGSNTAKDAKGRKDAIEACLDFLGYYPSSNIVILLLTHATVDGRLLAGSKKDVSGISMTYKQLLWATFGRTLSAVFRTPAVRGGERILINYACGPSITIPSAREKAIALITTTSIDSMICFSRPDVQPQFLVSLVANMLMFYLFVGKLSLGESVEKLAVAEIMIYPVVLIKKDPDTSRFGLGVKATCRQYVRAERERPFGFSLRCDSELCSATDPRGLKLKYHIEKNKRVRGSGGEWVSTPRFRIDCEGCSRRAMLDIPPGVTQLRSNVYVSDYPTVPQLTWRDRESNMHDHSTPISAPSENTLHEDTSKLSISEGASSTSRLDGPLLSGTPAPSLKSRKRARAPSAGEGAVVLKKKSRDVVGQ